MVIIHRVHNSLADDAAFNDRMNRNTHASLVSSSYPLQFRRSGSICSHERRCAIWKCVSDRIDDMHNDQCRLIGSRHCLRIPQGRG